MQRQMTRCGILALMFVCAKPSMTSSKLVLFQMHEMMRKIADSLRAFFFPLSLTRICSRANALSPRKD